MQNEIYQLIQQNKRDIYHECLAFMARLFTYSMKGPNLVAYCAKIAAFLQVLAPGPFRHDVTDRPEGHATQGLRRQLKRRQGHVTCSGSVGSVQPSPSRQSIVEP